MPVEDHPKFAKWKAAQDHLQDATQHYKQMLGKPGEALAKRDLDNAQAAYDKISDEID